MLKKLLKLETNSRVLTDGNRYSNISKPSSTLLPIQLSSGQIPQQNTTVSFINN